MTDCGLPEYDGVLGGLHKEIGWIRDGSSMIWYGGCSASSAAPVLSDSSFVGHVCSPPINI